MRRHAVEMYVALKPGVLASLEIVDQIRPLVQSEKLSRGETPRQLTEQEEAEIKAFGHAE